MKANEPLSLKQGIVCTSSLLVAGLLAAAVIYFGWIR
jgi:hypothetical protein